MAGRQGTSQPPAVGAACRLGRILNLDVMRPNKQREFESELSAAIFAGSVTNEADVLRFCIEAGMTNRHSAPVLKELKRKGVIDVDFQVPDLKRMKAPRSIRLVQ